MKLNKRLFLCLIFVISSLSGTQLLNGQDESPDQPLDLYLLIGQSNMAGRAPFTEEEAKPLENCYLLNNEDKWEIAKNPLNRHSTIRKGLNAQKLNPGYSFTKVMLAENGETPIGLIVNAKGGSKIEEWAKDTRFYKEAVRRAKKAQENGTLKGILWHQGESNEKNPEAYLTQLVALVTNLREDLDSPVLPFVAGQVNKVPGINDAIAKLPSELPHTSFVSSEGLTTMDRWHFDAKSMKLMGERYAEEILKLQKK